MARLAYRGFYDKQVLPPALHNLHALNGCQKTDKTLGLIDNEACICGAYISSQQVANCRTLRLPRSNQEGLFYARRTLRRMLCSTPDWALDFVDPCQPLAMTPSLQRQAP